MTQGTKEWATTNVNFSLGCPHGCHYCYARSLAHRFGWKAWDDWRHMTLKPQMATKTFRKKLGWIMSPSSHDLTALNVDLAIQVFRNILQSGNNLLIVSKPSRRIVQQLCDALDSWQDHILWRFSIGTLDDHIRRSWEPYAPSIDQRLKALHYAYETGWHTSVSVEPFLDDRVVDVVRTVQPWVTETIWVGPLNRQYVAPKLWAPTVAARYMPTSLAAFKRQLDALQLANLRYKDLYLAKLPSAPVQRGLLPFFPRQAPNKALPQQTSRYPL